MLTFAEGEEAEVNENDEIVLGDIIISLEACEGAGGGIRTFSETGNCVSDGAQHAASFRLRPHGAGGGSGDVPPPEGDFITGRLSERMKVAETAALA